MKKAILILTFATAVCSFTSCDNKLNTYMQMNASNTGNINTVTNYVSTQNTVETESTSHKKDNTSYEDIAFDMVERYYKMMPEFMLRFSSYIDQDDTVTFKLDNPYDNYRTESVPFGHISGKGLEFNSIDDILNYRKTVYSERYASDTFNYECVDISDKYKDGDYINDADVETQGSLYSTQCIMYKGKMYVSMKPFNGGWIGHMKPNEPIIITDVTDTSFRAYYPSIYGSFGEVSSVGCDIVDFIIDQYCGDWRIDNLEPQSYSLYVEKMEELSVPDTIKDTDDLSANDYTEARQRILEEIEQYKDDTPAEPKFTTGVSNGNTYTSEYAGFRLVAPENAEFLDQANLYTEYMMPTRFMYEEEKTYYLTAKKDASVSYYDPYGNISVWFYNIKERYPLTENMSAESFIQREFRNDHGKGDLEEINGPDAVNICGQEYLRISSVDSSIAYSYYVRKIDDEYIVVINARGSAVDDIESRFEPIC